MRVVRTLAKLLLALYLAALSWAPAAAGSQRPQSSELHLRFRATGAIQEVTSGRYTFFPQISSSSTETGGVVLHENSGRRFPVPAAPNCQDVTAPNLVGGSWLLFNCARGAVQLYAIPGGPWQQVASQPSEECGATGMAACEPIAVGSHWIHFDRTCYHCGDTNVFFNIDTKQLASDPTTQTTAADLNSPTLARRLCSPLRVPAGGSLSVDGQFAIVRSPSRILLERCHSRKQITISTQPGCIHLAASPHAVVWTCGAAPNRVSVIFLPSERRFVATLPESIGLEYRLDLALRHVYIWGGPAGQTPRLWQAIFPLSPPRRR
jgi:hypothetical protein